MAFAENRGGYWRGRYKIDTGKYGTVKDDAGGTIRFRTKREAEQAAEEEEARVRKRTWRDPSLGRETFGAYATRWYAAQDLAASTMQTYRRNLETHLLTAFEEWALADIKRGDVDAWEKRERALGYAESTIKTWRATFHLIMSDAVDEELITDNPVTKRRGRGKRAGRTSRRGPEKAVTDALGILLLAERAALLSGRDDEFVAVVTKGYTGMRWGEMVGLETEYVRGRELRVEWQLYELDTGELHRCPPKDDSRRTIDLPRWHSRLLLDHIAHSAHPPCACHGRTYVFRGHRPANGAASLPGPKLVDVARRAGVSTGTVSNVLNRPDTVPEATRVTVRAAVADLGYVRSARVGELAAHWRRSGFASWLFHPAATGRYPGQTGGQPRPVPILGEPWPGVPARGRGAALRADACWLPIAPRLTPHGLRHSHKTIMDGLSIPAQLKDERMGHMDGSVQARYSHTTAPMRESLMEGLTGLWLAALAERRTLSPGSPVGVLDRLLRGESSAA
ncbi:LacI family DNA-binding transcriptional regulator [Longispora fulva]|uniref:Integrase n=1 Tax=Longispora fulva TaxID=619741 RepID=A0A8J7GKL1_9ACTN|nr:LacI family DNA-binding transcriptional regulator [Longispora fulva]MBG6139375.1 integrase [Longispora fulva]